jgi:hypothetical protein
MNRKKVERWRRERKIGRKTDGQRERERKRERERAIGALVLVHDLVRMKDRLMKKRIIERKIDGGTERETTVLRLEHDSIVTKDKMRK